ncbi:hypothetical protein V1478_015421 [Vespula squamosa]|uniref:Uncharacterized protein n=1 Tax=Vespula squamosa TaxID=30214 RepID=A0ABD2A528_VESSQ
MEYEMMELMFYKKFCKSNWIEFLISVGLTIFISNDNHDQRKGSSICQTDCQPQRLWYVKPIVETEGHYRVDFGESNYLSVMFELVICALIATWDIRKIGGFVRVNPKRNYSDREIEREREKEEEEEEEERNKYTQSGNRDLLLELYQSCCEGILDPGNDFMR